MIRIDLLNENAVLDEVLKRVEEEKNVPLQVSIMGQTGVGKTSLIQALFHVKPKEKKDLVLSSTLEIHTYEFNKGRHKLLLHDLPGIGQSKSRDDKYLKKYQHHLRQSDIVLWAIHADSRSFVFDLEALSSLLGTSDKHFENDLFRKLTFVLTKADLVIGDYQTASPWVLAEFGDYAIFVPQKATKDLLARKEKYIQEVFILRHNDAIFSHTYRDKNFEVPGFQCDEGRVYYPGVFNEDQLDKFKKRFPQYQDVFERLYNNYRVVSCSARYQYNLNLLLEVITSKLDPASSLKFSNFFTPDVLDRVPIAKARTFNNLIVIDQIKHQIIFDLAKNKLPAINPTQQQGTNKTEGGWLERFWRRPGE